MEEALRYLLSGLSYGMLLFLIASGLSLILGVMGILNLAHGSLYMIGAYVGLWATQNLGAPWVVSLAAAALSAALLGLLMERFALRRLHRQYNQQVLLTLGLVYILGNLALWTWGSFPMSGTPPAFLSGSVAMGRFDFPVYRLALLLFGAVVAAGLWWFQERTRAGAIVRAGMDDRDMTMALGINYPLVCSMVFALGALLAGLAGHLGAPLMGASWNMAFPVLLSAMIVVVLGGVGRVEGTLLAALLIGVLDTLGKIFMPDLALFTIYLVFIAVLIVRPTGLLGRQIVDDDQTRAAAVSGPPVAGTARWSGAQRAAAWLVAGALAVAAPWLVSGYLLGMLTEICIFALFALSLNLLMGQGGLFSLGHAAFFGLGAYVAAIMVVHGEVNNYWVIAPAALILCGAFGAVAGAVALRTRGVYFIFVTLAIGELMVAVALRWSSVTGGSNGLFGLPWPELGFGTPGARGFFYLALAVLLLGGAFLWRLSRSTFGTALQGIRDNRVRMQHLGYRTAVYPWLAFVIAAAIAGLAGTLYAFHATTVVPRDLGTMMSTLVMLMVILGGARHFAGPVIGAILVTVLQYGVGANWPEGWDLVLGLVFIVTVWWLPGGLAGLSWPAWRKRTAAGD